VGDDAIQPEIFRLAAIADCDVVAVPFVAQERWETSLGLLERSAENRLNIVAAAPLGQESLILGLTADFTLWTEWAGPFTGRISHPLVTVIGPDEAAAIGTVAPAQAANRMVSRQTNLVDGRPWRLLDALTA
jgi:hypothetical protein